MWKTIQRFCNHCLYGISYLPIRSCRYPSIELIIPQLGMITLQNATTKSPFFLTEESLPDKLKPLIKVELGQQLRTIAILKKPEVQKLFLETIQERTTPSTEQKTVTLSTLTNLTFPQSRAE